MCEITDLWNEDLVWRTSFILEEHFNLPVDSTLTALVYDKVKGVYIASMWKDSTRLGSFSFKFDIDAGAIEPYNLCRDCEHHFTDDLVRIDVDYD